MSDHLWKTASGPSAGLVQEHYVRARKQDLKRRNPELEKKLAALIQGHRAFAGVKFQGDKWLEIYRQINKSLQAADLTINFRAESWFTDENQYDSYTQT